MVWLGRSRDPGVLPSCLSSSGIAGMVTWSLKAHIVPRSLGAKPQAHGFRRILPLGAKPQARGFRRVLPLAQNGHRRLVSVAQHTRILNASIAP